MTLPQLREKILKEFDETICSCRWIITTPEHKKKDCPHYTYSEDKKFLSQALTEVAEETYKAVEISPIEPLTDTIEGTMRSKFKEFKGQSMNEEQFEKICDLWWWTNLLLWVIFIATL